MSHMRVQYLNDNNIPHDDLQLIYNQHRTANSLWCRFAVIQRYNRFVRL